MKRLWVAALGLVLAGAGPSFAGAVLDNGSGVKLGVNDAGNLNFEDIPGGTSPTNSDRWGVAFDFGGIDGYQDATSPGCYCEGWGVAVNGATSGGANESAGTFNLTIGPLGGVTASTATSVVSLTSLPGLTVTQVYEPSSSTSLFKATVTIANDTGAAVTDVTYRRVMDWDVPPTEFSEFVTIAGLPASALLNSHDNGFCSADILDLGCFSIDPASDDATYLVGGPFDHGALFDFGFGSLANGESVSFNIFYGAALGEGAIFAALASVGVEVYSLGYSTASGEPDVDGVVYAFGFSGVGGTPIPEPGTLLLLGSGMTALALRRRRKA